MSACEHTFAPLTAYMTTIISTGSTFSGRIKRVTHATTWVNLENIILHEINKSQKSKSDLIPFMWGASRN
jgi:hypothetical protein